MALFNEQYQIHCLQSDVNENPSMELLQRLWRSVKD